VTAGVPDHLVLLAKSSWLLKGGGENTAWNAGKVVAEFGQIFRLQVKGEGNLGGGNGGGR